MRWLDRLKALRPEDCGLPTHRQNRHNPRSVSFDSAQVAQSLASEGGGGGDAEQAEDAREAFEERAAIMEYDGGLSREDAERQAAEGFPHQYAHAREAREPPTSEAVQAEGSFAASTRARAREDAGSPRVAAELYPPSLVPDEWGDMRPCEWCRNLARSGRCMSAWRGEMRAARDYAPTKPGQPQRCIGYRPNADDPDQRHGKERWPDLTWQLRDCASPEV